MEVLEKYLKKDREGRVKDRIRGIGIRHHMMIEFQKKLHNAPIGREICLAGFISLMDRGYFLEFPPGSGIGIFVSGHGLEDYVEGVCLVKGVVRPLMDGMNVVGKQLDATKLEEDYYPAYDMDIAPLTPFETFSLFKERINAPEHLAKALFLSPTSSPVVLSRMGGVSTILDFPSRVDCDRSKTKNMAEIADVVLHMVPSWHRSLNALGFSFSKISRVDSKLGTVLRERNVPRPEVGVIYPRLSYDSVQEFYEAALMENTIVLQEITTMIAPDFDRFLQEIQWSIMINHAQLRRLGAPDLPSGCDQQINDWFNRMRDKGEIYEHHLRFQGLLDMNFQGRRGIILRVMAALARFEERQPTESHLKASLKLQEGLLEEFIDEHGGLIAEYEEAKHLKTWLEPIKKLRNLIFDICQSDGSISKAQILQEAQKLNVKRKDAKQVLFDLLNEGYLYQPTHDEFYKLTP
ncbi:MAG: hypothetical protein ACE5R6_17465 [Candidatus Heimdallarchaeota archaeon]